MLRPIGIVSALFVSVAAGTAMAEPESTVLFSKGAWYVEIVYDAQNGGAWCAAVTDNGRGQQLDVTIFDSGAVTLYVWDRAWDLAKRAVDFRLDVDYSRWDMRGIANGQSVSLGLDGEEEAVNFLDELYHGSNVAVYSDRDSKLASFSLRGSAAALLNLFDCGERIGADRNTSSADPFNNVSDPFTTSTDPFN